MNQAADWLVEWAQRPQRYDLLVLLPNLGRGGAQRVAALLINAWAEQGYRICVATFSDKTEDAHRLDKRVTRLKVREFLRIRTGRSGKNKGSKVKESVAPEPPAAEWQGAAEPTADPRPAPEARSGPEAVIVRPVSQTGGVDAVGDATKPPPVDGSRSASPVRNVGAAVLEELEAGAMSKALSGPAGKAGHARSPIEILRTMKRTVRRRVRAALFPVREAGRILRRRAREARRSLRAAGRETRRELRSTARAARANLRSVTRETTRELATTRRDLGKGVRGAMAGALGLLDWLSPVTDRLHFRGAMQCLNGLCSAARDAGLPQRVVLEHRDLLTDRAKCRQVLAARMLMEHVQAPVTLAFLGATNITAALARAGLPTRLVISERNDPARQELQPVWQELRPLIYAAADVVTANSKGAVEAMRPWMPASRLAYVPNPLRVPADPGGRGDHPGRRFISVGRLVPQKRVDLVLRAFSRLSGRDGWTFEILGDGPDREALEMLAGDLGVGARTRFHGHVDPFPHLYAADIFVLASDFEGMPNALLEAMACGVVPIVNDATPGPLEFVEQDLTGLVVPAGDLDALAEAMDALAADELRRARLAAGARDRISELAFDHVLDTWTQVLQLPAVASSSQPPQRMTAVAR